MIPQLYVWFRHWSTYGSVYMIADTHFEDDDCQIMDPTWVTPQQQIFNINRVVTSNDTLIHLGDVGRKDYITRIRARYKILVTGNHDDGETTYADYFDEVYTGPLFIGQRILLSHEPIRDVPFCLNIHGHEHYGETQDDFHLNVAANMVNYKPVNLGTLLNNGILHDIKDIHRMTIDNRVLDAKWKQGKISENVEGLKVYWIGKTKTEDPDLDEFKKIQSREKAKVKAKERLAEYGVEI